MFSLGTSASFLLHFRLSPNCTRPEELSALVVHLTLPSPMPYMSVCMLGYSAVCVIALHFPVANEANTSSRRRR